MAKAKEINNLFDYENGWKKVAFKNETGELFRESFSGRFPVQFKGYLRTDISCPDCGNAVPSVLYCKDVPKFSFRHGSETIESEGVCVCPLCQKFFAVANGKELRLFTE